eukprot:m.345499 g.345499  ORF g.345499 m.345499 type:complete len:324 (+) comp16558_c0_seq5:1022-1993(+)
MQSLLFQPAGLFHQQLMIQRCGLRDSIACLESQSMVMHLPLLLVGRNRSAQLESTLQKGFKTKTAQLLRLEYTRRRHCNNVLSNSGPRIDWAHFLELYLVRLELASDEDIKNIRAKFESMMNEHPSGPQPGLSITDVSVDVIFHEFVHKKVTGRDYLDFDAFCAMCIVILEDQVPSLYLSKRELPIGCLYVGSTCLPLSKRLYSHKYSGMNDNRHGKMKLYQHVEQLDGWDNFYIELHEVYPCNTKDELFRRERQVQRELKASLTERIAGRKWTEYYEDNKEHLKQNSKEWYEAHREEVIENMKKCRTNNADKLPVEAGVGTV